MRINFFKQFDPIVFSLSILGCDRHDLTPIKDASILRDDCHSLYQSFPPIQQPTNVANFDYQNSLGIRIIEKDKWTPSILSLNPYMVCSYREGIQIWMQNGKNHDGGAYYVASAPESNLPDFTLSNHFVFEPTSHKGIFKVKQDSDKTD